MAFKLTKKQIIFGVAILAAGVGAYLIFRTRKIRFFDNVWCEDGSCSIFSSQAEINDYIEKMGLVPGNEEPTDVGANTGMLQLIFPEPHGLSDGDVVFIEQDPNPTYPMYNGWTTITVLNKYVVRTSKVREGSSPAEGGYVITQSAVQRLTSED